MDEARALVADQALWPRVRDFLWDFASQVHESWLGGLVAPNYQTLLASPRVKRHVLSSLRITPCFHTFPKGDWSRLLLLDGATLEEIAKWLGAVACAGDLRCVTDGATVRELKAALPGIYPDVFGYTMYFGKDIEELGSSVVRWLGGSGADVKLDADFVVGVGCSLLNAAVAHLPEPLRRRLQLKLPNYQTTKPPNYQTTKLPNMQLLLKLRFPEAYKLCC